MDKYLDLTETTVSSGFKNNVYKSAQKIALNRLGYKPGDVRSYDEARLYHEMLMVVIEFFVETNTKQIH